ncbi:spore protease YyaC [Ureibacillus acetophenoni]|uniref:Putative sporulation protein YyaC n=1 Tax=Ureibacillus acetophenoni TaxID=614649 RepID=A0A285UC36_9BACL|nr:spore protease YyaC [Ureibacillus acetophenoni]SOC39392.1 putative sporulation protein YyaC [Ureibacillus acetophenoni]
MQNINETVRTFVHHEQAGAVWRLSDLFLNYIPFDHEQIIFCCIGTDRSTGDSLGPLTGSFLTSYHSFPFKVIGTLEDPLHAVNLPSTVEELQQLSKTPFVIAIDACLGSEQSIGQIIVHEGPLLPGKAVKKELPAIGDISIKGIVNVGGFMEMLVLQNTRLKTTYSMSDKIARALLLAWQRYSLKGKNNRNNYTDYNDPREQIGYSNFS